MRPWIIVGIIVLVAAGIRLFGIDFESIWLDEGVSWYIASKPFWDVIQTVAYDTADGVLHYLILHFWLKLGDSEFTMRLLSVLFAILTIPFIFLITKRLARDSNNLAGYLSAVFLCLSPFHIYHSQEVRCYTLLLLLSALSFYFVLLFVQEGKYRTLLFLCVLAVVNALLLYTHYICILIIFSEIIIVLIAFKDKIKTAFGFLLSQIFSAIIFLPWLPVFLYQLKKQSIPGWIPFPAATPKVTFLELLQVISCPQILLFYQQRFHMVILTIACIILWCGMFFAGVIKLRKGHPFLFCFWSVLLFLSACYIYSVAVISIFVARVLIFILIPVFCLVSIFITRALPRFLQILAVFLLVFSSSSLIIYQYIQPQKANWREVVYEIAHELKKGKVILIYTSSENCTNYYLKRAKAGKNFTVDGIPVSIQKVAQQVRGVSQVWLIWKFARKFAKERVEIFEFLKEKAKFVEEKDWFILKGYKFVLK
jgi:uncharacterized membrane protein